MDDDAQRPRFTWDVGLDAAVRIGDPARWREALAALPEP